MPDAAGLLVPESFHQGTVLWIVPWEPLTFVYRLWLRWSAGIEKSESYQLVPSPYKDEKILSCANKSDSQIARIFSVHDQRYLRLRVFFPAGSCSRVNHFFQISSFPSRPTRKVPRVPDGTLFHHHIVVQAGTNFLFREHLLELGVVPSTGVTADRWGWKEAKEQGDGWRINRTALCSDEQVSAQ